MRIRVIAFTKLMLSLRQVNIVVISFGEQGTSFRTFPWLHSIITICKGREGTACLPDQTHSMVTSHSCFLSPSLLFLPWVHRPCRPISLKKLSKDRLKLLSQNTGGCVSGKGKTAITAFNHKKHKTSGGMGPPQGWQNLAFLKVCMAPVHMTGRRWNCFGTVEFFQFI